MAVEVKCNRCSKSIMKYPSDLNKNGEYGSYALHTGFNYAVHTAEGNKLIESPFSV